MDRRDLLRLAGTTAVAAIAGCTSSTESSTSPPDAGSETPTGGGAGDGAWPMAEVDAANTAALPAATGPTEPVSSRWTFDENGTFEATPAIADGTVYAGTDEGHLYAVDATDGTEQWAHEGDRDLLGPPAVAEGQVYVVAAGASVRAHDAATGDQVWSARVGQGDDDRLDWVESAPTVVDGSVYVGGTDGNLHAIDAETGDEQWRVRQRGNVPLTPAVADGTTFGGASDGPTLVAAGVADGPRRWETTIVVPDRDVTLEASPTVLGDTVYTGVRADDPSVTHTASGRVAALATDDGSERWRVETAAPAREIATDGEAIYVATLEPSHLPAGALVALDPADGSERWRLDPEEGVHVHPTLVGDWLYTLRHVGYPATVDLCAVDPDDGGVRWRHRLDFGPDGVAVVNGTAFVGSESRVYALE